jgi:hypothetical protein
LTWLATALGAVVLAAADPAPAPGPWVMTCDIPSAGANLGPAVQQRKFRIGAGSLQEWNPVEDDFGPNLCQVFTCAAGKDRMEGAITSASLILTVGLDPGKKTGWWRTTGASGLARTSGSCSVKPDAGAARPAG